MPDEDRARAAVAGAERFLNAWHGGPGPRDRLLELAAATADRERFDRYGSGERIERLERRVAELLGHEAAVFMPSGTMAQQIALRIWSDRRGIETVAFHPTCHLELHEEKGYERLHGLHGKLVGDPNRLITLDDLEALREPLAGLLLELPQREIGGLLPTWDDLREQVTWAREREIALHMDGARLWEAQPFYDRPHAEIAALFDSVYVSFYKGLGGMAGAALAGDAALVAEARVWQRRHGATSSRCIPSSWRQRSRSTSGSSGCRSTPRTLGRWRRRSRRSTVSRSSPTRRRPPCSTSCSAATASVSQTRRSRSRRRGRCSCSPIQARPRRRAGSGTR